MLFNRIWSAAILVGAVVASPIEKRQGGFQYGSTKVHGVNIGGWLVLEPFITPSIFEPFNGAAVDEYTLCQNAPNAAEILQQHWSTWATQSDFQTLASHGFNLVRIPIGYWAFQKYEQDTYVQGAADYLDQAIGWARAAGLKVWIDLHGAPRSQNGFDNSGQRQDTPDWAGANYQDTISFTEGVINQIAAKYATSAYSDVIVGIELLNEPLTSEINGGQNTVKSYYQNGFNIVRQNGATMVIIQDGFIQPSGWNGFLTGSGNDGAIVDHHEYQVFTDSDNALSPADHVSQVYARVQNWGTGMDKFVIAGEWSAAMTDCAMWLNGYGRGARYDGSYEASGAVGSCAGKSGAISSWSSDWKQATTNYINAQRQAFDQYVQGWIVWNFKTESAGDWSVLDLISNGVWQ